MNEELKTILEQAIREERYFHAFYTYLADKANKEDIKENLKKLAEQELMHKEKLESLSFEKLGESVIPDMISEIEIKEEVELTPLENFKDVPEMLAFAIKHENMAQKTYEQLAKSVDDIQCKELFLMCADEEKKHGLLLTGKLAIVQQTGAEVEW